MGIDSVTFLCATRLLAAWIVLPFMYVGAIGVAYLAPTSAVVQQLGFVSRGGYLLIFWQFQNAPDLLFSVIKGMCMATVIVLVACYYGYKRQRRTCRGRDGDGEVDGPEPCLCDAHGCSERRSSGRQSRARRSGASTHPLR